MINLGHSIVQPLQVGGRLSPTHPLPFENFKSITEMEEAKNKSSYLQQVVPAVVLEVVWWMETQRVEEYHLTSVHHLETVHRRSIEFYPRN